MPQFGLIAEKVAKVNPDLVVREADGKINTVRYDAINAMLLNEFLKEHRKVEELRATVAQQQKDSASTAAAQQKQIDALMKGLQKVNDEVQRGDRIRRRQRTTVKPHKDAPSSPGRSIEDLR